MCAFFDDTVKSIRKVIPMPGVPPRNWHSVCKLADGFSNPRVPPNKIYGYVRRVDGIALSISEPPDNFVTQNYCCYKGIYAVTVKGVVDRFIDSCTFHKGAVEAFTTRCI